MSKKENDLEIDTALKALLEEIVGDWFHTCDETGVLLDHVAKEAALEVEYLVVHSIQPNDFIGIAEITETLLLDPTIEPEPLCELVQDIVYKTSPDEVIVDDVNEDTIIDNDLWSAPFTDSDEEEDLEDWTVYFHNTDNDEPYDH